MSKPLIIEALEEIGPCDTEALSGHLNQSQSIVNAMLVKFIRNGLVKSENGMFSLTDKGRMMNTGGNDRGVCTAEPAPRKASAPVVQSQGVSPADTAQDKGCGEVVRPASTEESGGVVAAEPVNDAASEEIVRTVKTTGQSDKPVVSKAERLRQILRNSDEMTSGELASAASLPVNYINGMLRGDVKAGRITLRKRDGKSMYQWVGDSKKTPQAAVKEITQPPDVITVPTSTVLGKEIHELDEELIQVKNRFAELKKERARKGDLLLMVQKLEEFLNGECRDEA